MRILLALDGSNPSLVARDLVAGLPWPADTTIHAVSAYQVPVDWTGGVGATMAWVGDIDDAVRDEAADGLRSMAAPLMERGLAVEYHVARGRPADVIAAAASDLGADLIVTGSRGRGPIRSMLLGSVAAEVAADAACSVLVARGPAVSKLLVGTDGSPSADCIPDRLASWQAFRDTTADVVAVSVPDPPGFELMVNLYGLSSERLAEVRHEGAARAQADADRMAARLAEAGIAATAHVRAGDAAHQILDAARDHGSDLIVTGSRGLGQLQRIVVGSVARNVLVHATCSVLVVRDAASHETRVDDYLEPGR